MIKRKFGWTGVKVSVIGQGAWMIEEDPNAGIEAAETLPGLGLKLGMTHIDTAEMYGDGHTEELAAEAMAGQRDKMFLVSKVLPSHGTYRENYKGLRAELKAA